MLVGIGWACSPQEAAALPYVSEWFEQVRPKWKLEALGLQPIAKDSFVSIEIAQHDKAKMYLPSTWYRHARTRPLRPLLEAHVRRAVAGELSFTGCGTMHARACKATETGDLSFRTHSFRSTSEPFDASQTPEALSIEDECTIIIENLLVEWQDGRTV